MKTIETIHGLSSSSSTHYDSRHGKSRSRKRKAKKLQKEYGKPESWDLSLLIAIFNDNFD
jgi:hypothetical protein